MFLIAFIVGVFAAVLVKYKLLDYAERRIENPSVFWHYIHIGINLAIGISLIFLFWSWIVGSIGLGFVVVGLASVYVWIL